MVVFRMKYNSGKFLDQPTEIIYRTPILEFYKLALFSAIVTYVYFLSCYLLGKSDFLFLKSIWK